MIELTCFCDGGYNNFTKSNGYGSFKIISPSYETIQRMEYNFVDSSNEAEYQTLTELLFYVKEHYSEEVNIRIFADSKLLVNQINGLWKLRSENLFIYYRIASELFKSFKHISLVWVPRKIIVKQLGH